MASMKNSDPILSNNEAASLESICQDHSKAIMCYCETCSKLLCNECYFGNKAKEHHDHSTHYIETNRKELSDILNKNRHLKEKLSEAIATVKEINNKIIKCHESLTKAIRDKLSKTSEEDKESILTKLDIIVTCKQQKLQEQKDQLNEAYCNICDAIHAVENTQNECDKEFGLKMKKLRMNLEKSVREAEAAALDSVRPVVSADIQLVTAPDNSTKLYLCAGERADPSKCTYQRESLRYVEVNKEMHLQVSVLDSNGEICYEEQSVTAELYCLHEAIMSEQKVQLVELGHYKVLVTPVNRGRHMLAIKVNGSHIVGSPTPMFVHIPPQQLGEPVATITGLKHPVGLTCSGGRVLTCERECDRILEVDRRYGVTSPVVNVTEEPMELVLDSKQNIFVTTHDKHLHKINCKNLHKKVGREGTGREEFKFANGIDVFNGKVFVCDSDNHRIKIYDLDLNLIEVFGKKGSKPGQFNRPMDLTFDSDGKMYVTEEVNNRVQIFNNKTSIGCLNVQYPVGIAWANDYLYIACAAVNFLVIKSTAEARICAEHVIKLEFPEGIIVDEDGFVYVTADFSKIVVY